MKFIMMILLFFSFAVYGEPVDMLDYQINELVRRRDDLKKQIEKCNMTTRKFKIAGVSSLGAAAVGAAANITLYSKIQNMGSGGSSGSGVGMAKNKLSKEEKDEDFCNQLSAEEKAEFPDCD